MAATFSRTTRALHSSGSRRWALFLVAVLLLLGAWATWFTMASVSIYEITGQARLEARGAVHPIASAVTGRIVELRVGVGDTVETGDVLFVLDAEAEGLALARAQSTLAGVDPQIEAIRAQIAAEEATIGVNEEAVDAAIAEARAWMRESEARSDYAEEALTEVDSLVAHGLATGDELRTAQSLAASTAAEARARRMTSRSVEHDGTVAVHDRLARIAAYEREIVELEMRRTDIQALARELQQAIAQRQVHAPIGGRVGELHDVALGSVVTVGESVGSIVPDGDLHVVAYFPATVAGRLEPGQSAQLRFLGYPWTQFGTARATVTRIDQEPVDGGLRVELEVLEGAPPGIPLEHGLPAVVEVEVERVSPFELVVRAAAN